MHTIVSKIIHLFFKIAEIFIGHKKIQNKKIVVDNFFGRGYGDNPKYIIDQLLKSDPGVDVVWLVNNKGGYNFPKGIRVVKYGSLKAAYEYATAHIWIDNVKNNYKGQKRAGQFYLQTWHGGIAFKKIERAVEQYLDPNYIKASKKDSKETDVIISNSDWMTKNIRDNFWYDGRIVETGFPRNDIFFKNTSLIKDKVQHFYDLNNNCAIVLYAPTFRNHKSIKKQTNLYEVDGDLIRKTCEEKFGGKYVFLERVHPNVADQINLAESKYVKNANSYPDMQELLVAADVLITDFSSSVFDFILNKHRVFLFAKDYDDYIANERELNFDIKKDLPFSFANSESELIQDIENYDDAKGKNDVSQLISKFKLIEDGHASERVAKMLCDVMD